MKKNITYLAGALLSSAIMMFGCSEDIPSYSEVTVDKAEVFIQADGNNPTAEANITAGNGNYKIIVADENIATATLNGDHITFNGLKNGTTTATVIDWTKHSAVITIKVKEDFELKLDKTELTMVKVTNPTELVSIVSGNGGYQVESSNSEVATAELTNEGKILITALTNGVINVTVTDADGNKQSVKVTVCENLLTLEDTSEKIWQIGESSNVEIKSGNGEYKVISDNPAIATATIVDNAISITGVAKGETNITITDKMGLSATVKVKVILGIQLEKTTIDFLEIGKPQDIAILDGSGDYSITNDGKSLNCSIDNDKTKLTISGIEKNIAFNQKITVKDNVSKTSIDITVKEVNYLFETYGNARWFIEGSLGVPSGSSFETKDGREYLSMGTTKSGTKQANGYVISFVGDRTTIGAKQDPTLYRLDDKGNEVNPITITDLRIIKTDKIKDGNGQFWIKFREKGKNEDSYIVTWT